MLSSLPLCISMLVDFVDTNALQCVGLVLFPLAGALSFFLLHTRPDDLADAEGEWVLSGELPPPPPPAGPDWARLATTAAFHFGTQQPLVYLAVDIGSALAIGLLVLFWADLQALWRARVRQREGALTIQRSYRRLLGERKQRQKHAAEASAAAEATKLANRVAIEQKRAELREAVGRLEELELKVRGRRQGGGARSLAAELRQLRAHATVLRAELEALGGSEDEAELRKAVTQQAAQRAWVKLQPIRKLAGWLSTEQAQRRKDRAAARGANLLIALRSSVNGLATVAIYFADIISDVQVLMLLLRTGNTVWAVEAGCLLVLQYVAVYLRVLPYLQTTFGAGSALYRTFLLAGFPFGLLALDCLMFLEPFGLLAVLPLPQWLKQFVPAYKATRVIAEVTIESMPQCLLQSYILVVVERRVATGTAQAADLAMLPFASVLPKSITISTVAMLRIWIELVRESRQAGLSVRAKAARLWNVGEGLPLDALQKGSIVDWSCAYRLDPAEVLPLLDALEANLSLVRLDLSQSGLEWDGPRASGAPLIAAMARDRTALAGLQALTISHVTRLEMPIDQVREGGEPALAALGRVPFLVPGGALAPEILFMGDLLRLQRQHGSLMVAVAAREQAGRQEAAQLLAEARAGAVDRAAWERRLKRLMVECDLPRDVLQSLLTPEVLHLVRWTVPELRAVGFSLPELQQGGFTASEMRAAGVSVAELKELGYTVAQLRAGATKPAELLALGCTPSQLRQGGYTAVELKGAGLPLETLKHAGCSPKELRGAAYPVAELRRVGFEAKELRAADVRAEDMRSAGYLAAEMKAAGFDARRLRAVGFSASELHAGGFSASEMRSEKSFKVSDLKAVGYSAVELREGGFGPKEMEKGGFPLGKLKAAGFTITMLKGAGYEWHDLVIQCHATYDELIRAGFQKGQEGLDANHQLFRAHARDASFKKIPGSGATDGGGGASHAGPEQA